MVHRPKCAARPSPGQVFRSRSKRYGLAAEGLVEDDEGAQAEELGQQRHPVRQIGKLLRQVHHRM